jgi:flagellar hook assembly protein FlgD
MKYQISLFALLLNVLCVNAGDIVLPAVKEAPTKLKVYPNPASSYVIISYALKTAGVVLIEIANMHGEVVKTAKVNSQSGPQRLNVTLNGLTSGIYMVRIVANNNVETKKLVVY